MHVHVVSADGEAKFWLESELQLQLAKTYRYNRQQLKEVETLIEEHYHEPVSAWQRYFSN